MERSSAGGGRGSVAAGSGHDQGGGVRTGAKAGAGRNLCPLVHPGIQPLATLAADFSPQVSKKIWKCQNEMENADHAILLARAGEERFAALRSCALR